LLASRVKKYASAPTSNAAANTIMNRNLLPLLSSVDGTGGLGEGVDMAF
jgi:hypothetical protein